MVTTSLVKASEACRGQSLCWALGGTQKWRPSPCSQRAQCLPRKTSLQTTSYLAGGGNCLWLCLTFRPLPMLFPPLVTPFLPCVLPSDISACSPYSLHCKSSLACGSNHLVLMCFAFSSSPSPPFSFVDFQPELLFQFLCLKLVTILLVVM